VKSYPATAPRDFRFSRKVYEPGRRISQAWTPLQGVANLYREKVEVVQGSASLNRQHRRKEYPFEISVLRYPFDFRQMFLGRQVVRQCTIHCRQRQLRPRYPFVYPRLGARCAESSNPRKFVSSSLSQHQLPSSCQIFVHCPSLSQLQIRRVFVLTGNFNSPRAEFSNSAFLFLFFSRLVAWRRLSS
jgi:hypothetical protein